jgi:hypothetical protein
VKRSEEGKNKVFLFTAVVFAFCVSNIKFMLTLIRR